MEKPTIESYILPKDPIFSDTTPAQEKTDHKSSVDKLAMMRKILDEAETGTDEDDIVITSKTPATNNKGEKTMETKIESDTGKTQSVSSSPIKSNPSYNRISNINGFTLNSDGVSDNITSSIGAQKVNSLDDVLPNINHLSQDKNKTPTATDSSENGNHIPEIKRQTKPVDNASEIPKSNVGTNSIPSSNLPDEIPPASNIPNNIPTTRNDLDLTLNKSILNATNLHQSQKGLMGKNIISPNSTLATKSPKSSQDQTKNITANVVAQNDTENDKINPTEKNVSASPPNFPSTNINTPASTLEQSSVPTNINVTAVNIPKGPLKVTNIPANKPPNPQNIPSNIKGVPDNAQNIPQSTNILPNVPGSSTASPNPKNLSGNLIYLQPNMPNIPPNIKNIPPSNTNIPTNLTNSSKPQDESRKTNQQISLKTQGVSSKNIAQSERQDKPRRKFITTYGLPHGWQKAINHENGRIYYIDHNTRTTHWNLPPEIQSHYMKKMQSEESNEMESTSKTESKAPQGPTEEVKPTLKRSLSSPNLADDLQAAKEKKDTSRPVIDRSQKPK